MKPTLFILLYLIFSSCQKKEEIPGCGCDGPTAEELKDVRASYVGTGTFLLRLINAEGHPYESMVASCTTDETWTKTVDITNPDYVINAELKRQCDSQPLYSSFFVMQAIRIKSIEKVL